MTNGRDLPWLQDTVEINVQGAIGAAYRDVVILDAWNRPIDPPFNLTVHDLGNEVSREALKDRLRQAAVLVDLDGDRLGDDWEERYLGGLEEGAGSDPDKDGEANLLEYALGSRPNENGSINDLSTGTELIEGERHQFVTFRRRLGAAGGLEYVLQWSDTGEVWRDAHDRFEMAGVEITYDGTGTEAVKFLSLEPSPKTGLVRVKVGF